MSHEIKTADRSDVKGILKFCEEFANDKNMEFVLDQSQDYFKSLSVYGDQGKVLIAKDINGDVTGMTTIYEKDCYVNGQKNRVGYLGNLKVISKYKNRGLLFAKWAKRIRGVEKEFSAKLFFTTIMETNKRAQKFMQSRVPGFPIYRDWGKLFTVIFSAKFKFKKSNNIKVRVATEIDFSQIEYFWNRQGQKKQFFPKYRLSDFIEDGILPGMHLKDLFLAYRGDQLVGTIGGWDQSGVRSWHVRHYSWLYRYFLRLIYNSVAVFTKHPPMPEKGKKVNYIFLTAMAIEDDNREIFESLMAEISKRHSASLLMAALHEKDDLLGQINSIPKYKIVSRLFVAYWKQYEESYRNLKKNVPYIEIGSL